MGVKHRRRHSATSPADLHYTCCQVRMCAYVGLSTVARSLSFLLPRCFCNPSAGSLLSLIYFKLLYYLKKWKVQV